MSERSPVFFHTWRKLQGTCYNWSKRKLVSVLAPSAKIGHDILYHIKEKKTNCPHCLWEVSVRNSRFPVPCAFFDLQLSEEPLLWLQTPHLAQTAGGRWNLDWVPKNASWRRCWASEHHGALYLIIQHLRKSWQGNSGFYGCRCFHCGGGVIRSIGRRTLGNCVFNKLNNQTTAKQVSDPGDSLCFCLKESLR